MKKVITYGTFDLLHVGHINLLRRAKELGDYLIVGVTSDDFDKRRGKINVKQSLMERIEAVKATGIADEVIIEEYEGQKIDDIKRYNIDIFTVGSDWEGKFDYLKEYCDVVYLSRTEGISSSQLRSSNSSLRLGIVGNSKYVNKYLLESKFVNGLDVCAICTNNKELQKIDGVLKYSYKNYDEFILSVDAIYVASNTLDHFNHIEKALKANKHVLCESPITLKEKECKYLFNLAKENNLIFMEAIKTAYSTAFNRLILLVKTGLIGNVISIDSTCTSMEELLLVGKKNILKKQNSMCAWLPTAFLPILSLLGIDYKKVHFSSYFLDDKKNFDLFTKIDLNYKRSVATIKVGKGVKSEGELIISGTKGYIYVPAPWWKMDYFEVRFETSSDNKRYFYQLDGEGIRYELLTFLKSIESKKNLSYIDESFSLAISSIIEKFNSKENLDEIIIEK